MAHARTGLKEHLVRADDEEVVVVVDERADELKRCYFFAGFISVFK